MENLVDVATISVIILHMKLFAYRVNLEFVSVSNKCQTPMQL